MQTLETCMQRSALLCRSRQELSNEYLLAKIGVDTAENEPLKVHSIFQPWDINFTEPPRPQVAEETGWKLCHADVFRAPPHCRVLAVAVGSGVQILGSCVCTLAIAGLGLVAPNQRGTLVQLLLFAYVLLGGAAGFVTARLYKFFRGLDWKWTTIMCAVAYPGFTFSVFLVVDLFLWKEKSSGAVPFGTMVRLLLLSMFVLTPS